MYILVISGMFVCAMKYVDVFVCECMRALYVPRISAVVVHPTEDFIATGDIRYVVVCVCVCMCVCVYSYICVCIYVHMIILQYIHINI